MDARGTGPRMFAPNMSRDLYDPEVIFSNIERDRGDAVYDALPERVRVALARAESSSISSSSPRG